MLLSLGEAAAAQRAGPNRAAYESAHAEGPPVTRSMPVSYNESGSAGQAPRVRDRRDAGPRGRPRAFMTGATRFRGAVIGSDFVMLL